MRTAFPAVLLLALTQAWAQDAPLGRLFLTAGERRILDGRRLTGLGESGDTLTINGVVRASPHKIGTVWINGTPLHGPALLNGINPAGQEPGRVSVAIGKDKPCLLKVGESFAQSGGEQPDSLKGGHVTVHPAASFSARRHAAP